MAPIYQPYTDFTAQSRSVAALMSMYAQLEQEPNARVELAPIVVFMAFAIESYVNSLGARHVRFWEQLERLPWKNKIHILHTIADKPLEWGKEPLQFATEVFGLRDKLAHGKPERLLGPPFQDRPTADKFFNKWRAQPAWYEKITKEWAVNGKLRFHVLMVYLGSLFDLHESDHLRHASGGLLIDDGSPIVRTRDDL